MNTQQLPLITIKRADGTEADIPKNSVTMFESMDEDRNKNFPNARCYLTYFVGGTKYGDILANQFQEVLRLLNINADDNAGDWLLVTLTKGYKLAVLKSNVIARSSMIDHEHTLCALSVITDADGRTDEFIVRESIQEVRDKMAPLMIPLDAPPENLITLALPRKQRNTKRK